MANALSCLSGLGSLEEAMEAIRKIVLLGMVLMPVPAFSATDCRVVEYPDHYEAVCIGNTPPTIGQQPQVPVQTESTEWIQTARQMQAPVQEQADAPLTELTMVSTNRSFGSYRPRKTQP